MESRALQRPVRTNNDVEALKDVALPPVLRLRTTVCSCMCCSASYTGRQQPLANATADRGKSIALSIRYDTIGEFILDWKAEYSALSSTRRQKKKLKRTTPVPHYRRSRQQNVKTRLTKL